MASDADPLTGIEADEDEDADALAGADADEAEDADAGALAPATGANGSCDVMCAMARAPFAGADVAAPVADVPPVPVAAGAPVAGVVTEGEVVLDDEPELCSSFGSWKASTPANKANNPTRRSFLRRSAALRAATRRLEMGLSIVLMSPFSGRQKPRSKARMGVWSGGSPARWPRSTRRCR